MPLYEYQCENCGERVEVIQKFSDSPLTACMSCGGKLSKLLSAPAIQFKGTGWYITDYSRGNGGSNGSKGDEKNGGSAETEGSAKPEAAAKSDEPGKSPESKSASKPAESAKS